MSYTSEFLFSTGVRTCVQAYVCLEIQRESFTMFRCLSVTILAHQLEARLSLEIEVGHINKIGGTNVRSFLFFWEEFSQILNWVPIYWVHVSWEGTVTWPMQPAYLCVRKRTCVQIQRHLLMSVDTDSCSGRTRAKDFPPPSFGPKSLPSMDATPFFSLFRVVGEAIVTPVAEDLTTCFISSPRLPEVSTSLTEVRRDLASDPNLCSCSCGRAFWLACAYTLLRRSARASSESVILTLLLR